MNFITEGLVVAAREGNIAQVKELVTNKNQNVNTVSAKYKVTPLHAARYATIQIANYSITNKRPTKNKCQGQEIFS